MPEPASSITHRTPTGLSSPWLRRFAPLVKNGGQVLDVACGNGRHARIFLDLGNEVTVIDKDLSRVQDLVEAGKIEAIEADLEIGKPWPLAGRQFDAVVVVNYLHRPLFPDLVASVAPEGFLIYETFAVGNERFGRPRNPDHLLRPNELLALTEATCEPLAFEQAELGPPRPAVVQRLCARRLTPV